MISVFRKYSVKECDILIVKDRNSLHYLEKEPPFVVDEMFDKADCILHVSKIMNSEYRKLVLAKSSDYYWNFKCFRNLIVRNYKLLL